MYITNMTHTPQSLRNLPIAADCGLVIAADCGIANYCGLRRLCILRVDGYVIAADCGGLRNYIIHQNKQQRTSWGVVGTRYMDKDSDRLGTL